MRQYISLMCYVILFKSYLFFQPRSEMLHNYDPVTTAYAYRRGDMKLIFSLLNTNHEVTYQYWYGPNGPVNSTSCSTEGPDIGFDTYQVLANRNVSHCDVTEILKAIGRDIPEPRPFELDCGEPPSDRFTNCNITRKPCLFNITADPCEYHNLASRMPEVVQELYAMVKELNSSSVPPRNKGFDPSADPKYFGGVWTPWLKNSLIDTIL